ncbi:MAG: signal peptidase I [Bacteroidetes bacterium]|nr:signal peptidase I [Bacteroidota bacterium]
MQIPFFGKKEQDPSTPKKKKSVAREWLDAAVFAIIAATIIRTFFIEAYTIPTPSMEKSLLVNDYLFVSKMHYGARLPMTPLAIPFIHNAIPFFGTKSYSEAIKAPYKRLWGFSSIERYDDVVFNFPEGDTILAEMPDQDYYSLKYMHGEDALKRNYTVQSRPIDKTDNYIKRCVGVPGDILELKQGILYVNQKPATPFKHLQRSYLVRTKNNLGFNDETIEDFNIEMVENIDNSNMYYIFNGSEENMMKLKSLPNVDSIGAYITPAGVTSTQSVCFPRDTANFKWNVDNYGPLTIPKKGVTVSLTPQNIALYERLISMYEKHSLVKNANGTFTIDGKVATQYTFAMDYYWMMGDNRHNSLDSRYWGFVPEDHVVGKAWFIWMSYGKEGIRWKRLFRSVKALED